MTPEELREKVTVAVLAVMHRDPVTVADAALAVVREAMREPSKTAMQSGVPLEKLTWWWLFVITHSPLREPSP